MRVFLQKQLKNALRCAILMVKKKSDKREKGIPRAFKKTGRQAPICAHPKSDCILAKGEKVAPRYANFSYFFSEKVLHFCVFCLFLKTFIYIFIKIVAFAGI